MTDLAYLDFFNDFYSDSEYWSHLSPYSVVYLPITEFGTEIFGDNQEISSRGGVGAPRKKQSKKSKNTNKKSLYATA
jgi:hypothetical protein